MVLGIAAPEAPDPPSLAMATGSMIAVLALVAINGFFVAAEFALVAARRSKLDEMIARGDRGAKTVQTALQHLDRYIAGTQLGITIASLALGWIGEPVLAHIFDQLFRTIGLNPSPTLSALNPTSVLAGSGTFSLTLTGTGFVPASVVRWNGTDRPTTFGSTTQLTAQIPAGDIINAGTAQVTVFNPTPGGGPRVPVERLARLVNERLRRVGAELEARALARRGVERLDRVVESARGAHQGNCAVAHRVHLVQTARLVERRHQEDVSASFNLVRQRFTRIAFINSYALRRMIVQRL